MDRVCRAAAWTVLAVLQVSLAYGQTTATIRGRVRDGQAAPVASTTVTVTSATGLTRAVPTTSDGSFLMANLPPTTVDLVVSARRFSDATRSGLLLEVGQTLVVDVDLAVAGVRETLVVTAAYRRRYVTLGGRCRHPSEGHRGPAAQWPQLPRARAAGPGQCARAQLRSHQVELRRHLVGGTTRSRRQHHHRRRRQQRRCRWRAAPERHPGIGAGIPDRDPAVHGGIRAFGIVGHQRGDPFGHRPTARFVVFFARDSAWQGLPATYD